MIGLKANFGKSVDLAGGDGKVMKDFSFIASFVPILEKWTFSILSIVTMCYAIGFDTRDWGALFT